jgi:catechol 2,3-dioxygenase-like lactoylglutathione lyase family enzyme
VTRLHHVNLGVLPADLDAEIAFVVDVLGYRRIDVANTDQFVRRWFETDDGTQIHLSEDDGHRPHAKAHVALEVGEQFDAIVARLQERGVEVQGPSEFEGVRLLNTRDPAGNLFELRG